MAKLVPSAAIVLFLTVAQPCPGIAQTLSATTDERIPTFRVEIWADISTEFAVRVNTYVELRRQIESGLQDVIVTDDVGELRRARRSLARAIRLARPGAVQGEFFTATTSADAENVPCVVCRRA